jgi:hypothetical protein
VPLERPIQTRFRFGFGCDSLNLATQSNSPDHSPKGTPSGLRMCSQSERTRIALRLFVSIRFQVLFHSPNRGAFHLSLTVLVHYRSLRVFSLGKWTYLLPAGLACPAVLKVTAGVFTLSPTGLSPSLVGLSSVIRLEIQLPLRRPYNPHSARPPGFGLFPVRSPLLGE